VTREALVNAFQHAQATKVEVEITIVTRPSLRVRDDGAGIDKATLSKGRWALGIVGMRERAQKIGAQISIWSQTGAAPKLS